MLTVPEACSFYTGIHRPGGDYVSDITDDFEMIEPYLPESVQSILDIGCGMAGIDVFLKNRYRNARLMLLDDDGSTPAYGWNENCQPYSSRRATEMLLKANGIEVDEWIATGVKDELKADLVISLLSWGFHYPLSTYRVQGFCIVDLRKGREPQRGEVIREGKKSWRCAFTC
jgi:hypothetical protein